MKKVIIAAFAFVAIATTSCQKELEQTTKEKMLGRWETIQLTEPDRTVYNLYDSTGSEANIWLKQITFSFYSWGRGRRDNGPKDNGKPEHFKSQPQLLDFDFSLPDEQTLYLEDMITHNFNVATVTIRGNQMVITETVPQFRQYVLRFVGR